MPLPYAPSPVVYHNSETVVYKDALTFQRGSGSDTVMSTLHRLQGNKIR